MQEKYCRRDIKSQHQPKIHSPQREQQTPMNNVKMINDNVCLVIPLFMIVYFNIVTIIRTKREHRKLLTNRYLISPKQKKGKYIDV